MLATGGRVFHRIDGYLALQRRCLAKDPAERPGFRGIVAALEDLVQQAAAAGAAGGPGGRS